MMLQNKKVFLVSKDAPWSVKLMNSLSSLNCHYFNDESYINHLSQSPDWIFFFHWSKIVPKDVYERNRCVVIHTSNLPNGRGGSPIQNQILEGIVESRVNALVMEGEIDGGSIYYSLPVTLQGTISDIWSAIADRAAVLIKKCVQDNPTPKKQVGKSQKYKRNKTNNLPVCDTKDLEKIHRFIQMLDGDTYPKAFIEIGNFKLEFSRSKLGDSCVLSDVLIRKIDE